MMLLDKIKQEQLVARKSGIKERSSLLTTLYSEAQRIGFDDGKRASTDAEVTAVIKKFIKNIDECLAKCPEDIKPIYQHERSILEEFLPQQLSDVELTNIIQQLYSTEGLQDMKSIMTHLKTEYSGRYDGKTASEVIKQLLG